MNQYVGRFAPSPTGHLHFGSLIAAVGSYLQARKQHGEWRLRIEDIDPPREVADAADDILKTLDVFGFEWDGPVIYQSQNLEKYRYHLETLIKQQQAYRCRCSRKVIAEALHHSDSMVYPQTCRSQQVSDHEQNAIRVINDQDRIQIDDAIQGSQIYDMQHQVGDFVIKRGDGFYSYQLAVAIDDGDSEITQVVRGFDLMDSTPRQVYLQQRLGLSTPAYAHLPVAVNRNGEKLSKQTHASPLDRKNIVPLLYQAVTALGLPTEKDALSLGKDDFWQWAIANWQMNSVPQCKTFIHLADN